MYFGAGRLRDLGRDHASPWSPTKQTINKGCELSSRGTGSRYSRR